MHRLTGSSRGWMPPRRQAAQALLAAWDASGSADALDEHLAGLRAALVG